MDEWRDTCNKFEENTVSCANNSCNSNNQQEGKGRVTLWHIAQTVKVNQPTNRIQVEGATLLLVVGGLQHFVGLIFSDLTSGHSKRRIREATAILCGEIYLVLSSASNLSCRARESSVLVAATPGGDKQ